jgi:hypothetical protein
VWDLDFFKTVHTESQSTQTDRCSPVGVEQPSKSSMKCSLSNGCQKKTGNDDRPPPLPIKRSAAAQNSFRQRMGGVSEDRADESMSTEITLFLDYTTLASCD